MRLPVQGPVLEEEEGPPPRLVGFLVPRRMERGSQGRRCLHQGERNPSDELGHKIPESHSATPPATPPPPSAAASDTSASTHKLPDPAPQATITHPPAPPP